MVCSSPNGIKKVIIFGFILHLVFFASIFEIYFQSPIIPLLTPLSDLENAPAKRLILFVADGLRAESFYKNDCERTPFLKKILLKNKIAGISHTRVPTESRPGHVALIAGFYEDPSAVAKGWQENPVDFDSVFNRSQWTYSWGSPDILPIFSKGDSIGRIKTDSYSSNNEDFSGKLNTSELDIWVFRKVKEFLKDSDNIAHLKKREKVIFFLHLLGLDTAGHVHKPHSQLFTQNLKTVDAGIREIINLFERAFDHDNKTSYIFTADHGMTDWGSHGGGLQHETETPFLAWGAGIKDNIISDDFLVFNKDSIKIPKINIEQADIASLMATLIGVSVPVNNVGKLPDQILNVSDKYLAEALRNNAFQITNQFEYWLNKFEKAKFQFLVGEFKKLSVEKLYIMKNNINKNLALEFYKESMNISRTLMTIALDGINYYQSYYQTHLLTTISLSMIVWILFLFQQLLNISNNSIWIEQKNIFICLILSLIVLFFCYVQSIPLRIGFYFTLPFYCFALLNYSKQSNTAIIKFKKTSIIYLIIYLLITEMFVLSFFYRFILTYLLILISISFLFNGKKYFKQKIDGSVYIKWFISCIILSVFPSLPVVNKDTTNNYFLFLGIILWTLNSLFHLRQEFNSNFYRKFSTILIIIFVLNLAITIYQINKQNGLNWCNQIISWIILVLSFITPLFSSLSINLRIKAIGETLFIPFCLMSLTYEPLFFIALFMNLYYWLVMETNAYKNKKNTLTNMKMTDTINEGRSVEWDDIRRAYFVLLFILVSFFGTGNIASVSSFDPNWVRCLVSTFSPFLMASLIIIKLLMPILLVTCTLKAVHVVTEISMEKMFTIILIICDTLCLNFLFLVTNKGSWLEIGTSISHFVIMEFTVLVLFILYCISNILTSFKFNLKSKYILPQTFDQPKTK